MPKQIDRHQIAAHRDELGALRSGKARHRHKCAAALNLISGIPQRIMRCRLGQPRAINCRFYARLAEPARQLQHGRFTFGLMCFMTTGGILQANEWGLTLAPFLYRSHARGYHFYFIILPAIALIFAKVFTRWREVKLVPPGMWLFYVFCLSASFSIF